MAKPRPRRISDFKPTLTKLAQTSHYEVRFGRAAAGLSNYLRGRGVDTRFTTGELGLLCFSAQIPFANLATANVTGAFTGIGEKFAHSRIFTPITLNFYVDKEYKVIKFLEHWMEYITGGNQVDPGGDTYFFQLNYPKNYKSNDTTIVKFEKNHKQFLEYRFIGLFPLSLNSTRVQYGNSQVLKATASFSYDRYIAGESSSLARDLRRAYNDLGFGRGNAAKDGLSLKNDQLNALAYQSMGRYLNRDNPRGEYSSLTNGGFSSINVQANYPATAPGISP